MLGYENAVRLAGELGQLGAELIGDLAPLVAGGLGIVLGKGGGDEGGDDAPAALAGMGQRVAHEVNAGLLKKGSFGSSIRRELP